MFRQLQFKVAVKEGDVTKIYNVTNFYFDIDSPFPVASVVKNDASENYSIDGDTVSLIEFTGKFSKDGKKIFSGDVLELIEPIENIPAGLYIAQWTPGAFMAYHVHEPFATPLFDENISSQMMHRGNQWDNADIVQKYLDQFKDDVKLEAKDLPNV